MKPPVWVLGRVPNGYWHIRSNRVKYMNWLGRKLRFRKPTDWYGLTRASFHKNHGGGMLATMFRDSPIAALRDYKPNYDWKPWLLSSTPQAYWRDIKNRRAYMKWLEEQLGFTSVEGWYGVTQKQFRENGGNGLLAIYFKNSPLGALKEFKPRVKWREWEFPATPQGFWKKPDNRKRYMKWLGKQLGYRKPEDWYQVTRRDFHENCGGAFLRTCKERSPLSALQEYMPNYDWKEWRFYRVPNGFWKKPENRKRYMKWLGQKLGFRKPKDWYKLTREDVRATGGGALLSAYYNNSLVAMLRDCYPSVNWDAEVLYGRRTPTPAKKKKRTNGKRRLAA